MKIAKKISDSVKELSAIQCITVCAILLALRVVLGYFSNFSLAILPSVKIGFDFLPIAICGMMFGPVPAAIVGGLGDILSFMLNPPGMYFPGWTLMGIINGFIWGLFLYQENNNKSWKFILRLVLCRITIAIPEIFLGTLWLIIQYNWELVPTITARAIKQLVSVPLEATIVYAISFAVKPINSSIKRKYKKQK